ncbi:hypothetical protein AB4Y85_15270 [Microvirga sp. 2YAF29]|uniref:hypothetical protein n=1 Tax=Microvirga sp. 2YAF29 TaxID=3233031 RepID=UPI003F94E961
MFSILRFILIVGAIFYYSPVRQKSEGPDPLQAFFAPKATEQAAPAAHPAEGTSGHLETMWQALPDNAKQAVVEKILTTSGFTPAAPKATDTLQPEDRQAGAHKPRG